MMDRCDNITTYFQAQRNAYFYAMALPYILELERTSK